MRGKRRLCFLPKQSLRSACWRQVAHLRGGSCQIVARKCLLPTYDVFDESRYFEPFLTPEQNVVEIGGAKVGLVICEDSWNDEQFFGRRAYAIDPVVRVVEAGAQVVINLSASPWARGRHAFRARMVAAAAKRHGVAMIYVNQDLRGQVIASERVLFEGFGVDQ